MGEEGQIKAKFDLALAAWTAAVTESTKTPDDRALAANLTRILRIAEAQRTKEEKK